jgi:hypothetical protein
VLDRVDRAYGEGPCKAVEYPVDPQRLIATGFNPCTFPF